MRRHGKCTISPCLPLAFLIWRQGWLARSMFSTGSYADRTTSSFFANHHLLVNPVASELLLLLQSYHKQDLQGDGDLHEKYFISNIST
jgi:hypothetical protein